MAVANKLFTASLLGSRARCAIVTVYRRQPYGHWKCKNHATGGDSNKYIDFNGLSGGKRTRVKV